MITDELVDYVKRQRQEGVSDQAIKEAILAVGWSSEDAQEALVAPNSFLPASSADSNINQEDSLSGQETAVENSSMDNESEMAVETQDQPVNQESETVASSQPVSQDDWSASNQQPSVGQPYQPDRQSDFTNQEPASGGVVSQSETPVEGPAAEDARQDFVDELSSSSPNANQDLAMPAGQPQETAGGQEASQRQPLRTEDQLAKPVSFVHEQPESVSQFGSDASQQPEPMANPATSRDDFQEVSSSATPTSQEPIQPINQTESNQSSQVAVDSQADK